MHLLLLLYYIYVYVYLLLYYIACQVSRSLGAWFVNFLVLKAPLYWMGWASVVPTLEAISYMGYGFVPTSVAVAMRLVAGVLSRCLCFVCAWCPCRWMGILGCLLVLFILPGDCADQDHQQHGDAGAAITQYVLLGFWFF